jgi:hypothetical protein
MLPTHNNNRVIRKGCGSILAIHSGSADKGMVSCVTRFSGTGFPWQRAGIRSSMGLASRLTRDVSEKTVRK